MVPHPLDEPGKEDAERMISVEQWAEIRRLHRVEGLSMRAIARRLGVAREAMKRALVSEGPARYRRKPMPSKLDPHKGRIAGLLEEFPRLSGVRIQIIIEECFEGSVSPVRVYLREVRPRPVEAYQRTEYWPGAIGQVDWARMPDTIPREPSSS